MTEQEKPLTREDVLKMIEEHGGPEGLDLSERNLEGIDLSSTDRSFDTALDLHGIELFGANLQESELSYANLQGATLSRANLKYANLFATSLQGSFLAGADLRNANLSAARLQDANLRGSKLQRACLLGIYISQTTDFEGTDWGDYILEEEKLVPFVAIETYRQLKMWHTNAGVYDRAGEFFYREMTAKRKAFWLGMRGEEPLRELLHPFKPNKLIEALLPRRPIHWAWSMLYNLLFGYGEKPERVVLSAVVVVLGLAAIYSASALTLLDGLYFSAVSFTALGYALWVSPPEGWVKALGAAEAFIGVFMMALFLITFVRKMTR